MVAVIEAPGGTTLSTGTEDLGDFIGKVVTVVPQETVASEVTSIVPGTPFDTVETQFTVSGGRGFRTPGANVCELTLCRDVCLRVIYIKTTFRSVICTIRLQHVKYILFLSNIIL